MWFWAPPLGLRWRVPGSGNGCGSGGLWVKNNPPLWAVDGQRSRCLLWTAGHRRHQPADKTQAEATVRLSPFSPFLRVAKEVGLKGLSVWGRAGRVTICGWGPEILTKVCNSTAFPLFLAGDWHFRIGFVGVQGERQEKEKKIVLCCTTLPWDLMPMFLQS